MKRRHFSISNLNILYRLVTNGLKNTHLKSRPRFKHDNATAASQKKLTYFVHSVTYRYRLANWPGLQTEVCHLHSWTESTSLFSGFLSAISAHFHTSNTQTCLMQTALLPAQKAVLNQLSKQFKNFQKSIINLIMHNNFQGGRQIYKIGYGNA